MLDPASIMQHFPSTFQNLWRETWGGIAGYSTKEQKHNLDLSYVWGPLHCILSLCIAFFFFQDFEDRFVVVVGGGRWYCCVAVLVYMNRRFSTISIHIYASIYFSYTIIQERGADRSHHFGWWFVALVPWKHGSFGGL